LENEIRERARNGAILRAWMARARIAFVLINAPGTERVPGGIGISSAAGFWIFLVMIAGFAAVSCGQHRV